MKIKHTRNFIKQKSYEQNLSDWITGFNRKFPQPTHRQKKYYEKILAIRANCSTPGQGIWHIMMDLGSVGDKQLEYFQDTSSYRNYRLQALAVGREAVDRYPRDKFLDEINYTVITGSHQLAMMFDDKVYWNEIKERAEIFMQTYPDYRLIEFIEDFYEDALKKLSK